MKNMKDYSYCISVGEPWDFESRDGQNVIRGSILGIKNNQCLVFKSNNCLTIGQIKGDVLILTPRHKGNDFSDLQNELVVVNGSILQREYNNALSEQEFQENAMFAIVGSIRREQKSP